LTKIPVWWGRRRWIWSWRLSNEVRRGSQLTRFEPWSKAAGKKGKAPSFKS